MRIACLIRCQATLNQVLEMLATSGFTSEHFAGEPELLLAHRRDSFDMILVDTEQMDERLMCSWLGCRSDDVPLVILTPDFTAEQTASALNSGAEDVIHRPVATIELQARLQAVLRRFSKDDPRPIKVLDYSLDRSTCQVLDRGVPVDLRPREFALAWLFFSSPGVFLSRKAIGAAVWGMDEDIARRTIEQHVYKLRKKLNLYPERGVQIRTAYNKGYRFELHPIVTVKEMKS